MPDPSTKRHFPPTAGLVLAGGRASRMGGGDKALLSIGGETILARTLARLKPQCERLVISANGDLARFSDYGVPVVADDIPGFAGPLAGILAGFEWTAKNAPGIEWIASVPGDCPFLPSDLVAKLHAARIAAGKNAAYARSGARRHPAIGLWPVSLRGDLRRSLTEEKLHKVELWAERHGAAIADWPDRPVDPFFNVNTPEDLARAETIAGEFR